MNIQPALIRNPEKDNKLMYVQAHNGTISNYKEMATKYKVDIIDGESDSNVLAKLISKVGFQILEEYEGSAALVMHFVKEPNTLYAFHGQSKQYNILTEERPLHFVNVEGSGTYISSEDKPLEFIANGIKATPFKFNVIYKLSGDKIEEFKEVKRETAVLKKTTTPTHSGQYNFYEERWNEQYKNKDLGLVTTNIVKNICCCSLDNILSGLKSIDKLRFAKGFYYLGSEYAHGLVMTNSWGYTVDEAKRSNYNTLTVYYLYFWHGILLQDFEAYEEVCKEASSNGIKNSSMFFEPSRYNKMTKTLKSNAIHPFSKLHVNPASGYTEATIIFSNEDDKNSSTFFAGSFRPLFTDYELYFRNGDVIGYKRKNDLYCVSDLIKDIKYLEDWGFGDKPKEPLTQNRALLMKSVSSCEECWNKNLFSHGEYCETCTIDPEEAKYMKAQMDYDKSDNRAELCHTIATQVNPIIGDLADLIEEVETSGYKDSVSGELEILVNANNKLKEIVK
jgi:hypothetical protein